MDKIKLFQTERVWHEIKKQVIDLTDCEHNKGYAQNGELVKKLESRLAEKFNRLYCVTFGNCSDALTAAVIALGLPPGAKIGVSDYTFTATAHAVSRAGYVVVPLDVDNNYCLAKCKDYAVDAVIAVDIFGNMTDLADLKKLNIPIIIDAAQSFESHNSEYWSAEQGIISCVSFSPSKTISSWGSGGAALTDDPNLYQVLKKLRLHGKNSNEDISIHPGLNSMLSSFEAACIWAGLDRLSQWQQRREKISRYIAENSVYSTGINFNQHMHTFHKLVFQTEDRDEVINSVKSKGIDAVCHYQRLIHQEKMYSTHICKNSQRLSNLSFTVPNQHTLFDSEVEKISKVLS